MIATATRWHQRRIRSQRRRFGRRPELELLEDRRRLALTPFDILAPVGTIDDSTPEISWEASTEAVAYDVVISTNDNLSSPIQTFDDVAGSLFADSRLRAR
jgi:hypothetical protein